MICTKFKIHILLTAINMKIKILQKTFNITVTSIHRITERKFNLCALVQVNSSPV